MGFNFPLKSNRALPCQISYRTFKHFREFQPDRNRAVSLPNDDVAFLIARSDPVALGIESHGRGLASVLLEIIPIVIVEIDDVDVRLAANGHQSFLV